MKTSNNNSNGHKLFRKDFPELPIESDVPIPDQYETLRLKLPYAKLSVGQSFLVPFSDSVKTAKDLENHQHKVRCTTLRANKRMVDKKFITRTVREGIRVWRVEL